MTSVTSRVETFAREEDPLWYKDAIIYQLHVRAYMDSSGNGIGDFQGLTQKLDYLQDLGVTALWLQPFYPSPLKDDGYDISDYTNVNPLYGDFRDFRAFLREAHVRGLRVITELVLNHTSDRHAWFERSRRAPAGSQFRDWYVWSDTPERYKDARIIFKDFEPSNWSWDPVAKAYYWHRFYAHQPDLNFENPQVKQALMQAMDFWLRLGVDGLRLDAIPYLYEREGTMCENLPETHTFLKDLRRHIDSKFRHRMLLAEANQWPEDAIAYFGQEDECQTAFHFPLMPRLFMALQMENRFPIVDIMQQTPAIPASCQWVLFLRNHDELTLEMVSDEERDYMYRMYAHDQQARINLGIRRRLAPLLGNNRRKIELMNGLLFSFPGTPVIYYGDEIGMGDNIYLGDRNGVRTPMQWSSDRNAGFSRSSAQQLYLPVITEPEYHFESVNVETQRNNPQSLFWWMKRIISLRQAHPAFSRGSLEFLTPENTKVLAFLRTDANETALVVANLSRFTQYVEMDLSRFEGGRPIELFGQTKFPAIGTTPYLLSLGPWDFNWFVIRPKSPAAVTAEAAPVTEAPLLRMHGSWEDVFEGKSRTHLERALGHWLGTRYWFNPLGRTVQGVQIRDTLPLNRGASAGKYILALVRVEYFEGEPDHHVLPLAYAPQSEATPFSEDVQKGTIARMRMRENEEQGVLYHAARDPNLGEALLQQIARPRRVTGAEGTISATQTGAYRHLRNGQASGLVPAVLGTEQRNTYFVYGDRLILKLFRRAEPGINPDLELGRFLTERGGFKNTPPIAGAIECCFEGEAPRTIGILRGFVANEGTAWKHTLDALGRYFELVLAQHPHPGPEIEERLPITLLQLAAAKLPEKAREMLGVYVNSAELLGRRTGELHLALVSGYDDPGIAPEPFTPLYQRSLYQSLRRTERHVFQMLTKKLGTVPQSVQPMAQECLDRDREALTCFRMILEHKIEALRMRCHGDYHLGKVLYTGKDFFVMDFEGEPGRALSERRIKHSPFRDVAGMLRSFHYASSAALFRHTASRVVSPEDMVVLRRAAWDWYLLAGSTFLREYLSVVGDAPFLPRSRVEQQVLLHVLVLDKAIHDLAYELDHRPEWIEVPLKGILELLNVAKEAAPK